MLYKPKSALCTRSFETTEKPWSEKKDLCDAVEDVGFAAQVYQNVRDKAHLRKVARMVGRLSKTHGKEYADLQRRLDVLC